MKKGLKTQKGSCGGVAVLIVLLTLVAVGVMLVPVGICAKNKIEEIFFTKADISLLQKPYTEVVGRDGALVGYKKEEVK